MKRKLLALVVSLSIVLSTSSCADSSSQSDESSSSSSVSEQPSSSQSGTWGSESSSSEPVYNYKKYDGLTADQIVEKMTLEQKVSQMVLPELKEIDSEKLKQNCYGGVLSKTQPLTSAQWRQTVDDLQKGAISSECGIPIIYGQDDVHGVYACLNAVIFPHNIGLAAANDKDLMYKMGQITADEAKLCHMLWNYSPVIAQSVDPRWGRTYECLGSDLGGTHACQTSPGKLPARIIREQAVETFQDVASAVFLFRKLPQLYFAVLLIFPLLPLRFYLLPVSRSCSNGV